MSTMKEGADQRVLLTKQDDQSFLTLSSANSSVEKGFCRVQDGRGYWIYVTAGVLIGSLLLSLTVLVLYLNLSREHMRMRDEIESLRGDVDTLKHRILEEDLLDQLKSFEDAVYDEEEEEENSGSDEYAEDYDVAGQPTHGKMQRYEAQERSKREVSSSVPVLSESYGVDFNNSEGLKLYESLISGRNNKTEDLRTTENPIKKYHRLVSTWPSKSQHKKYVGNDWRHHQTSTSVPAPIISRVSRVMQTDSSDSLHQPPPPPTPTPSKPHRPHKLPDGEVVVRVYQELQGSPAVTVSGPGDVPTETKPPVKPLLRRKKHRPLRKNLAQLETLDTPVVRIPRAMPVAHYSGDTSSYTYGKHPNYDGNGRLKHPDGMFKDWAPSAWMQSLGMSRFYSLENGVVTVRDSGVYLIYAQIYYVDEHDMNSFRVYHNTEPFLHCTTMTVHSAGNHGRAKSNTCHTSGAIYLAPGDTISLRDVDGHRYSLFEPAKSFFGLIKLNAARVK